jgi:hypothetical protein
MLIGILSIDKYNNLFKNNQIIQIVQDYYVGYAVYLYLIKIVYVNDILTKYKNIFFSGHNQ